MVNLITAIAYDPEKNLGRAYNEVMVRAGDGDWICFLDHDAMFTTPTWYHRIQSAIQLQPNAGMFTAITNRIGNPEQTCAGVAHGHDIRTHRAYGESWPGQPAYLTRATFPISGVLMCLSKQTWKTMGKFKPGFLGVDNRAHRDILAIGKEVYIITNLYVYHWYRGDGDMSHLEGTVTCEQ